MKQILRLLPIIIISSLWGGSHVQASHLVGGILTYKYIGDSTNIAHHYQVNVTVYRTTRWSSFSSVNGPPVCVSSSCFPNQTISLSVAPGWPLNGEPVSSSMDCVAPQSPNVINMIEHRLVGDVILPGTCSDFSFKYSFLCCRINTSLIANVSSSPSGSNRLDAHLNNTFGENTSPQYVFNEATFSFCENQSININHYADDPDGDSLRYLFTKPRIGDCLESANYISFETMFTKSQPFSAVSPGVVLDSLTGNISFVSTSQTGHYNYAFKVEDYRWVSGLNQYVQVGSSYLEGMVSFAGQCLSSVVVGPQLKNTNHPKQNFPIDILNRMEDPSLIPNADTVSGQGGIAEAALHKVDYNCLSTTIDLYFTTPIQCNTISTDGSEFRIMTADSILVPILAAIPNCTFPQMTEHITVELYNPLPDNGDFLASIRTGNDGNTLINMCGFEMPPHYTFVIQSNDCPVFSTDKLNKNTVAMRIHPNPNAGVFTVTGSGEPHVLRVYNMLGVCVIEENGQGNHLVNQAGLASGNYLVKVEYPLRGRVEQTPMTVSISR